MAEAKEITKDGVIIAQGGQERLSEADTVILATGFKGNPEFNESFKDAAPEVFFIGNCVKQGNILDAVRKGFLTAIKL
jgi:uncharacterized NAD(P)/FAD-binding protein YdhS